MLLLLFCFCRSLKEVITSSNYIEFVQKLGGLPALVLLKSRDCTDCDTFLPAWAKTMDHFEADPGVCVASLDCTNYPGQCHDLTLVPDRPAFVAFTKGRGRQVHPHHSLRGFIAEVQSLKGVDLSVTCPLYPDEFDGHFPYFVWESQRLTDAEICQKITHMHHWFVGSPVRIYYKSKSKETRYTAHLSDTVVINYTEEADSSTFIILFTKDYSMMPFTDTWRIEDGLLSKRRFVFIVHSNGPHLFADAAFDVVRDFVVGHLEAKYFTEAYPEIKIVTPAIVASNLNKTLFMVFNGVDSPARFGEVLGEIKALKYEQQMTLKLPKLFPKLADPQWTLEVDALTFLAFGAPVAAVLVLLLVLRRKHEAPHIREAEVERGGGPEGADAKKKEPDQSEEVTHRKSDKSEEKGEEKAAEAPENPKED
jgi:hypothetical protein